MNAGDTTTVWDWDLSGGSFIPVVGPSIPGDPGVAPLVADSWLVTDGAARALSRHRRRFTRACAGVAETEPVQDGSVPRVAAGLVNAVDEDRFWSSLTALIPSTGAWFPRVELADTLRLRVRPAPVRGRSVIVWDPEDVDPRVHPRVKGPDLSCLGLLRDEASTFGASEVLLTDEAGHVVEAANSNILWWEGDTLCAPHADSPVFGGITAGLVVEEARQRRIAVQARRVTRSELQERDVWLTNALHGIRAVTGWRGSGVPAYAGVIDDGRLRAWREWWDGMAEPLSR